MSVCRNCSKRVPGKVSAFSRTAPNPAPVDHPVGLPPRIGPADGSDRRRSERACPADVPQLVVDVDLSILGAPDARFAEYERQIRQEYAWVPPDAFRERRARVLGSFLGRPALYGTAHFATRLEARARENLRRSLARLGALPASP